MESVCHYTEVRTESAAALLSTLTYVMVGCCRSHPADQHVGVASFILRMKNALWHGLLQPSISYPNLSLAVPAVRTPTSG